MIACCIATRPILLLLTTRRRARCKLTLPPLFMRLLGKLPVLKLSAPLSADILNRTADRVANMCEYQLDDLKSQPNPTIPLFTKPKG